MISVEKENGIRFPKIDGAWIDRISSRRCSVSEVSAVCWNRKDVLPLLNIRLY
jgi:hypothetical protein